MRIARCPCAAAFRLQPGERALVVEDVITTGGSTREVIDIVRAAGAIPVAAGSIIDRSGGAVDLGIPRVALETLQVLAYKPEECPLVQGGRARGEARLAARVDACIAAAHPHHRRLRRHRFSRLADSAGTSHHSGHPRRNLSGIEGDPRSSSGFGPHRCRVFTRWRRSRRLRIENPIPVDNLQRAINRLLPPAIRVLDAAEAHVDFHPRFDAIAKTYRYTHVSRTVCSPFEWRYVHHYPYPLDEERMIAAARVFEGEHDFAVFAAADETDQRRAIEGAPDLPFGIDARAVGLVFTIRGQWIFEAYGAQSGGHAGA